MSYTAEELESIKNSLQKLSDKYGPEFLFGNDCIGTDCLCQANKSLDKEYDFENSPSSYRKSPKKRVEMVKRISFLNRIKLYLNQVFKHIFISPF